MSKSHGITCKKCGGTGLVWATAKSGKHYLAHVIRRANVSDEFIPHFKSCAGANAARDAKVLADEADYRALIQSGEYVSRDEFMRSRGHR
jgi:hypothetical protein